MHDEQLQLPLGGPRSYGVYWHPTALGAPVPIVIIEDDDGETD